MIVLSVVRKGRADYVACCTPLLVGRVIGIVRIRAEVSIRRRILNT